MTKMLRVLTAGALLLLGSAAFAQDQMVPPVPQPVVVPSPSPSVAPSPEDAQESAPCKCECEQRRGIKPGDVQRVFVLRSVDPWGLKQLLSAFPADVAAGNNVRAVSVSAPPAVVAAIEETIKRVDLAASVNSVEIVAYILHARRDATGNDLPPGFDAVARQVQELFGYRSLRLEDSLIATAVPGAGFRVEVLGESDDRDQYVLGAFRVSVAHSDEETSVQVENLSFRATLDETHIEPGAKRIHLSGDFDIREGQRVIIGKSGIGEEGTALIVVLSARVVE